MQRGLLLIVLFSFLISLFGRVDSCHYVTEAKKAAKLCINLPKFDYHALTSRVKFANTACGIGNEYAECVLRLVREDCGRITTSVLKRLVKTEVKYIEKGLKFIKLSPDQYPTSCNRLIDGEWDVKNMAKTNSPTLILTILMSVGLYVNWN